MKGIVNLGILAHVDAGKTTLTEQILWRCGAIREPGRVDAGTALTDFMPIERQRGISVQAATVSVILEDRKINLIDTPGHADFVAEVERVLSVLDAAVLVVSAAEGVQPQTRILWEALRELRVPTLFFINKTDRAGADLDRVMAGIRSELDADAFWLGLSPGGELNDRESLLEALCGHDDALLEDYLEDGARRVSDDALLGILADRFCERVLFPALPGAALNGTGVDALLGALRRLAPYAGGDPGGELAGMVFRVTHEPNHGRVGHVRLYSGSLYPRDAVNLRGNTEKIFRIREIKGGRDGDKPGLEAGDVGAVYGLNGVRAGDILGRADLVPQSCRLAVPLLRVRITLRDPEHRPQLIAALNELSAEDPLLSDVWEGGEVQVSAIGSIQLEVIEAQLRDRFGLMVDFAPPTVIYKETPVSIAEGFEAYTMPKPCWAVLRFLIEPLPRGRGVEYECAVSNEKIHYRYQGQIEQTLPIALEQGLMGWEVTDVKLTLIDGEDHPIHTHPLDFALATPLAVMDGLARAGTMLLEPMLRVSISASEACAGRIVGDFLQMRGTLTTSLIQEGIFRLEGRVPVATSLEYSTRLAALSGGEATLSVHFDGYEPCPPELGVSAPCRGVDPRERSKYILWKRSALQV